ncbi:uncharacterized protein LOC131253209 isoform X1 [Magnolia sinica]|uniref:uncharacterized protein LOC131253209 isoform X1 n=1 Tax=Magnolia sinica TaxID=86752 RepID=UPI002658D92B|nr:uncharacterized protein LOC131253209 isoform X1 [Magnolia sinica]
MVNGILWKLLLLKGKNSLPLPKLEGDERVKARSLATIYSHPVVPHEPSLHMDDFVCIKTGMQVCVKIYNTTKRTFIQAGLLKDGLCSVQDKSAGQFFFQTLPQPFF